MSRSVKRAIGAVFVAAALSIPATALAVFPGVNGKILITSGRGAGGDANAGIYIMDSPTDLTLDGPTDLIAGQHRHPSWSADGQLITFAVRSASGACAPATTDEDILVHDTVSGTTVLLGLGSDPCILEDHPTYSPDGASIAYESEVTNGSGQEDILISPADGTGAITNLTNSGTLVEQTPVWSPDGVFIYYARKVDNASLNQDIYRQRADGSGSPSPITGAATAANEFQPDISPDGTKLCYTRGPFGSADADVMVANTNGSGSPVEISATDDVTPVADYDCGWSPDGTTIAWTNGAFGAGQLQFAPSNDSGPITPYGNNSTFFDGNVDWSRDQHTCDGKLVTILGTNGDDDLTGTNGKDVAVLQKGADTFRGKGGADTACAGGGKDRLLGGKGRDREVGGPGDDHLFGGPGKDHLDGGRNKDKCVGGPGKDTAKHCERRRSI